jgi:hypothetical protein
MNVLQIGYNCFAKDKYSLQIHSKRVTEIETHSKTLQMAKRDVWEKENIVDNDETEYKLVGQILDRLIVLSISKTYVNSLHHVGGVQKGGNSDTLQNPGLEDAGFRLCYLGWD